MDITQAIQQVFNVTSWEKGNFRNYYFVGVYDGNTLNGCLECEFNELESYNPEALANIKTALPELDARAHAQIQSKFPEDDAGELDLNDIVLLPNGDFKLGYYTGRTPLGETYLYVSFGPDFTMQDEVAVEGY